LSGFVSLEWVSNAQALGERRTKPIPGDAGPSRRRHAAAFLVRAEAHAQLAMHGFTTSNPVHRCLTVDAKRKLQTKEESANASMMEQPSDSLVNQLGSMIFEAINTPKYRLYVYLLTGFQLEKQATITILSTICNLLYCVAILLAFLGVGHVSRTTVLVCTLLTIYIGPAIVLIGFAALMGVLAAFALYPICSVLSIWVWFFLTSQAAQIIGHRLGLDMDKDGDVDSFDVLAWASKQWWGKYFWLEHVHGVLNAMYSGSDVPVRLGKIEGHLEKYGKQLDQICMQTTRASPREEKDRD
jgi:hypothetical protein